MRVFLDTQIPHSPRHLFCKIQIYTVQELRPSMSMPILATKLFIPSPRSLVVTRLRLIERMNEGLRQDQGFGHKLTLISAPAGFGKTTLVSEWIADCERATAWLSLDEGDSDLTRFLTYLIAALQTIAPKLGEGVLSAIQSPQPPPIELILTTLLNEITLIPNNLILVLDDYHVIDDNRVDDAFIFLLDHLPPQMHLVITTREDPPIPLARLRARGQLTEVRAADLRFTPTEAADFLNQAMGLNLSAADVTALEARTEGWVAGLQLAALSLQGHKDAAGFIKSFTGNHRFVTDYLLDEVLQQQSVSVQTFLLRTSILDQLCAPLCDAVLLDASASGQETIEYLEHANLFIIPLDNERRWYRYHHLFADLLRQRLQQSVASSTEDRRVSVGDYHRRASQWYEDNRLELEAFHHAAAANDVERAERLIEGEGVPLHFRGAGAPVLKWLESLPTTLLDARPTLWMTYASALMMTGRHTSVEQKLQAAEVSLLGTEPNDKTRDLVGRIASMRATLAVIQHDVETMITQSRQALELLHPDNLFNRMAATWTLGFAYQIQGDRAAASQFYTEVISLSTSLQDSIYTMAAAISLGQIQEADNQLTLAAKTYRHALQLAGDPPQSIACEAYLGLAHIHYEWNELGAAQQHGQQCAQLTQQMESTDTPVSYRVFLARLRLAQGDTSGAVAALDEAETFIHQHNFGFRMPDVAAAQVLVLLRQESLLHQGNLAAAADLAEKHELPISQARVCLAQGDTSAALALLEPLHQQMEAKGWQDQRLKIMILQAIAHQAHGEEDKAVQLLGDALVLAEPGGFIRIFVDEGLPMARLLATAATQGIMPNYVDRLLSAFEEQSNVHPTPPGKQSVSMQPLVEPLSERELDVLRLLRTELNGPEIASTLLVSLNTMRTHTKSIYNKLGVNNRRAAVQRAEELNLY